MAANNSYIISEIGQTKRSPQGKINTGENLRIIQPSQAFPPLLASSTIDKVGHLLVLVLVLVLLEIDVPMTTSPTPIISPTPHRYDAVVYLKVSDQPINFSGLLRMKLLNTMNFCFATNTIRSLLP